MKPVKVNALYWASDHGLVVCDFHRKGTVQYLFTTRGFDTVKQCRRWVEAFAKRHGFEIVASTVEVDER